MRPTPLHPPRGRSFSPPTPGHTLLLHRRWAALWLSLCLVWGGWHFSACGPLTPPAEPVQEGTQEPPSDASGDAAVNDSSGQDRALVEPQREPTPGPDTSPDKAPPPDAGPDKVPDLHRETHPEATPDTIAEQKSERAPEIAPELSPESAPDTPPSIQAKAVSLRASFLQHDLQSGLMERLKTSPSVWTLDTVYPKGKQLFNFVFDGGKQVWGTATPGARQGTLGLAKTHIGLDLGGRARVRFQVDLAKATWSVTPWVPPRQWEVRGSWSGKPQKVQMTKQPDGSFAARLQMKQGDFSFVLVGASSGQVQTFAGRYPMYGPFPLGGVAFENGKTVLCKVPVDGAYRLAFWPLTRRWQLKAILADGVTAWDAHRKALQSEPTPQKRSQLTQTWITARGVLGGLPLRKGAEVLFVVEWKTRGPVYLAGSFNQWSTSASPMQRLTGTDFYYRKETLQAGHHEYKFVDSSAPKKWILDPNNTAIVYGGLGPNSVVQVGAAGKHRIHWHRKVPATQLRNTRDVFVYLPPGYEQNTQVRYPVLYMHDGQNLFDPKAIHGGWGVALEMDRLIAQKKIQPAIIVGVANTPGRMSEYTHTQDRIGGRLVGGQARAYASFLLSDLKPWIDGLYRTLPGHRNTGTMGSSLGGLISMWLGTEYPASFFRIGAMSSTFGWGKLGAMNPTMLDLVGSGSWWNFVVYIDSGSPRDNFAETIKMRDTLEKKGYLHGLNLQHWTEPGAPHTEAAWRKRLARPLTFLLKWK